LVEKYNLRRRGNTVKNYKYFTDKTVAERVANILDVEGKLIIEASPGPGLLTRELVKCGAKKVIGLEPEKKFLPELLKVQNEIGNGAFVPLYADFAKVDPHLVPDHNITKPRICREPAIASKDLFKNVDAEDWQSDNIPVKFVGIEGGKTTASTTKVLISYLARIPTRESIFEIGRCELAFFYTQDRLERLLARPGSKYYNRLSIMAALLCDINILHNEPCSSFDPFFRKDSKSDLHLVSMIPKKENDISIPENSLPFIGYFIRILMIKPTQPLAMALGGISPGCHDIVRRLGWASDIRSCDLTPEQYGILINEFFHWEENSQLDLFYSIGQRF
jgi:16S rRNA A1518/A1519 N6-dimethyltransferase RsmA/KsgA/DIM1 with predicted DNA glycosylase/AP lyase activity